MTPRPAFLSAVPLRVRAPPRPRLSARRCVAVAVGTGTGRARVERVGDDVISSDDGLSFRERAAQYASDGSVPPVAVDILVGWFESYITAATASPEVTEDPVSYSDRTFSTLMELIRRAGSAPIDFQPYHKILRYPFDYYKFGFDFASILLDAERSRVLGQEHLHKAAAQVAAGDNVIFLSNHQSEGDPYAIDALFDWVAGCDRQFCEQVIFMAGDRVRDDPVVSPFSAGRNLLTVYSKKHINDVPERREEKLIHNRRTIAATQKLFRDGGKCVWFAPSGGRDRRNADSGRVEISKFDEGAVDMMRFTAAKSGRPCHFYPMALLTFDMLPPPSKVGGADIGEKRVVNFIPMHMYVGPEIDWSTAVPDEVSDKIERRKVQCRFIENIVIQGYTAIGGYEQ